MLLTNIPYFREIIISSFSCDHCHYMNTGIEFAGEIQTHGARYKLKVEETADLQRQLIKSDTATVRIEDIDLEIPKGRGRLSNVEGFLSEVLNNLEQDQAQRKKKQPELYEKLEVLVQKLIKMMNGSAMPFTVTVDDVAGNSWIEPSPLDKAGRYTRTEYQRNPEQNASLGLATSDMPLENNGVTPIGPIEVTSLAEAENNSMDGVDILEGKMYTMPCNCPGCTKPAAMNMQMVNIPFFKQVIITAVICTYCDYRTNEVKTGGEIPELGRRITLAVNDAEDLKRDILKSETCYLRVPECNVEVQPGTMGGRFTTVEGLLTQMRDDLRSSIFDTSKGSGDSMTKETKGSWDAFFATLNKAIVGDMKFTVIMEDPLASSYVQSFFAPDPDPQIEEEEYERTVEEEEDLGLTDMRTHQNADGEYVKEEFHRTETDDSENNGVEDGLSTAAADLTLESSNDKGTNPQ